MVSLLSRIFIKDYKNTSDPAVRRQYGMLTGIMGIVLNLLLFGGKLFAGIITASVSVIADAINNLSDAGTSGISMVGMKLAGRPADKEHPFGHGRMEYVAGLAVAAVILIMGYELAKDSVIKIFNPEDITFNVVSVVILAASVAVKLYICLYNRKIGNLINSPAMKATAMDSLSDCISTAAVIAGLLVFKFAGISIDGYVGVFVALFVFKAGIEAAKESLEPLLGQRPDKEYVDEVIRVIREINPDIKPFPSAGITKGEDCYNIIKAGASASGCSSAIAKAEKPLELAEEMIAAVRRAYDETRK